MKDIPSKITTPTYKTIALPQEEFTDFLNKMQKRYQLEILSCNVVQCVITHISVWNALVLVSPKPTL